MLPGPLGVKEPFFRDGEMCRLEKKIPAVGRNSIISSRSSPLCNSSVIDEVTQELTIIGKSVKVELYILSGLFFEKKPFVMSGARPQW